MIDPTLGLTVTAWGGADRSPSHRVWEPIFIEWAKLHRRFWEATDDVGWWSGERANVSMLGNAIWHAGGYSLQEYGAWKVSGKGGPYEGRVDMYALIDDHEFLVEAKQAPSPLDGPWHARLSRRFGYKLWDDATANSCTDGCLAAACFLTHRIDSGRCEQMHRLVDNYLRTVNIEAAHEWFPSGYRADLFPLGHWDGLDLAHVAWPQQKPARYHVGVTCLLGFCAA